MKNLIRKMLDENGAQAFIFNIDCDGYEVSESTKQAFKYYDIELNEENLNLLANMIYSDIFGNEEV